MAFPSPRSAPPRPARPRVGLADCLPGCGREQKRMLNALPVDRQLRLQAITNGLALGEDDVGGELKPLQVDALEAGCGVV
jgi:hypothetical protein